eukprot:TRINITY_DN8568_c0_g1_i1.p1 TRINITY_DN8568_c0_g1~~TRINITY_DN8568_c0_g1_i1.p1  ORF type:complete len:264 (-),score=37.43 TRINITY_DN8568_c0_g1_i1:176-967(-)
MSSRLGDCRCKNLDVAAKRYQMEDVASGRRCTGGCSGVGNSCGRRSLPNGVATPATDMPVSSSVTFACKANFTMDNVSLATSTCVSNLNWSSAVPKCLANCGFAVTNGNSGSACGTGCPVSVVCNPGYSLAGAQPACWNGTWSPALPTCQGNPCSASPPAHGAVSLTTVPHGGSTTYSCDSGYSLSGGPTLSCSAGALSGAEPTCVANPCLATAPANGLVSVPHGGSTVYSCGPGFMLVGAPELSCSAGSLAGAVPTCVPLVN